MNANRLWTIGAVLIIVLLLLGTWFLAVSPQIAAAAQSAIDRTEVQAVNRGHEQTLVILKEQFEKIDEMKEELEELRDVIPATDVQAPFLKQVGDIALATGVSVGTVTFSETTSFLPYETADPELAVAMQSLNPSNYFIVPVKISVTGTTAATLEFLRQLQNGTRLFLAYDVKLEEMTADPDSEGTQLTVDGHIFVLTSSANAPVVVEEAPTVEGGAVVE